MNIFVLDTDPTAAAKAHCDCHVVKMILETTQILCGVHHRFDSTFEGIYKPTHLQHPCVRWAASCEGAYMWTWALLRSLLAEYQYRYEKVHASNKLAVRLMTAPIPLLVVGHPLLQHVFVGPIDDIVSWDDAIDVVASYRALYHAKAKTMKRPMRWTKRTPPSWFRGEHEILIDTRRK